MDRDVKYIASTVRQNQKHQNQCVRPRLVGTTSITGMMSDGVTGTRSKKREKVKSAEILLLL